MPQRPKAKPHYVWPEYALVFTFLFGLAVSLYAEHEATGSIFVPFTFSTGDKHESSVPSSVGGSGTSSVQR